MTEYHDRQTMERLHQHLARADRELRDAQHFLAPESAEGAEMDLVDAVSAARIGVATALERVRTQLGAPEPRETPSEATPQPGRVGSQPAVESTQEPREESGMHMPEVGGGAQEGAETRSWWKRWFGS